MGFSPTSEEETKLAQLKSSLEEHLKRTETSMNPEVRTELKKIAANSDFLFKYLRGRKLNVTKAFDTILKYAEVKFISYPEYFPNEVPDYLQLAIESRLINILSKKDSLGRTYFYFDTKKYDDTVMSVEEVGNGIRYLVEALMNSPDFLDNGMVILKDSSGVKFRYGKHCGTVGPFYTHFFKAFPVRVRELIFFNLPLYGKALHTMIKPFVKSKAMERLYVSSGFSDLHKRVSLDILPKSLGGRVSDEVAFVPQQQLLEMVHGNIGL